MECRDKLMLSMYVMCFLMIGHACGHCRHMDPENLFADVKPKSSSIIMHPAISAVFDTFVSIYSRFKQSVGVMRNTSICAKNRGTGLTSTVRHFVFIVCIASSIDRPWGRCLRFAKQPTVDTSVLAVPGWWSVLPKDGTSSDVKEDKTSSQGFGGH